MSEPKKTLSEDLREIGEAASEGRKSVRNAWFSIKLFATGLVMIAIGVSQAAFGWIGKGFLYRVLYPIPLIFFGGVILWGSFMPASAKSDEQESTNQIGQQ